MKKPSFREFAISSWAIDNRITIYLLAIVISIAGMVSYYLLPKENFPEIQWPVMFVSTPYPGTSAEDIENLVTRKIEKEIQGIEGIKEINSTSIQDFSSIFVEFETDVDLAEAKREVEDAVNRARSELPSDLPNDPVVADINLSEIPIMFINVSGPYDNVTLKRYAELLQEEIENELKKEILRVDLVGAREREIQINVDLYKMEAASVTMDNIEQAISSENVIISGGEIDMGDQRMTVRMNEEIESVEELRNLVIRSSKGNIVYLKDIATVVDGYKERDSYARLNGQPVLTLNVIKKAGENLVDAADQIKVIVDEMVSERFPEDLSVVISADQSQLTRNTLNELVNTIIIGFILVTIVLMFFMGVRDALFVGLAVPLSSFIAFAFLPALGFTMNLVVLFSFILAMGIVVDNAIVVIENTHRIFMEQGMGIVASAKKAAGEVIGPVFSGTLTTVAPFLPLLFWDGPVGEFMGFLPVVMIITLFASLFVAYVINPVFAVTFMKKEDPHAPVPHRKVLTYFGVMVVLGLLAHLAGAGAFGNFLFFMGGFVLLNAYVLRFAIRWFQEQAIPAVKNAYRATLRFSLARPGLVLVATLAFIVATIVAVGASDIKFIQFPQSEPNFAYIFAELPNGTDIEVTDSVTRILERRVYDVLGEDNPLVRSVITNVAIGAGDAQSFDQSTSKAHKSKITVEFVGIKEREGASTLDILNAIRDNVQGIAGAKVTVEQDQGGPPGSAPIEVQVTSESFPDMMSVSEELFAYLDSLNIPGIEQLKWDVDEKRPEMLVHVNREKARELGLSSGQIGMGLRTALFGKEVSQLRDQEDEYDIILRLDEKYRQEISDLLDMRITYMDQSTGRFRSVPISSVADVSFSASYGGINRTDLKKAVTITSNVLSEYNVNDVSSEVEYWVNEFLEDGRTRKGVTIEVGGQSKDQQEEGAFLGGAFAAAIILIFMILVTQFNSFSNVVIIMGQVLLSTIGVFMGHAIMGMDFSVVLSGVGLVVLAGIVVNNGIILLDFIQILRKQGMPLREAVIEGGSVRFTPVLLTASSTVLGLVPLALSLNINFGTLLSDLDPQIFFGGDSAAFWEPFSYSIIFGLTFATVVTLVIVPVLYYQVKRFEAWMGRKLGWIQESDQPGAQPPASSNGRIDSPAPVDDPEIVEA
ncbi:MAG: efflux RND transporter permease subunit [Bacteroidetes bacterium]|nr:MAG: efflux RND transporter permease subunit [Bacteroidota bacterium]